MKKKRRPRLRSKWPPKRKIKPRSVQQFRNAAEPAVSVIIPVMNEQRTLAAVIREASRIHSRTEIIVIANGCTDRSAQLARKLGAIVMEYKEPLGHDIPRAIGAREAKGEALLFIDADMIVPAKDLKPFTEAVLSGEDIALNDYNGPVQSYAVHPVVSAKHMLNSFLGRRDLQGASLTAIPHALSRRAVQQIGVEALESPPLAHAAAVMMGLRIRAVHAVPVGRLNRYRGRRGVSDALSALISGDHIEAMHWITEKLGPRGGFSDLGRHRERAR